MTSPAPGPGLLQSSLGLTRGGGWLWRCSKSESAGPDGSVWLRLLYLGGFALVTLNPLRQSIVEIASRSSTSQQ